MPTPTTEINNSLLSFLIVEDNPDDAFLITRYLAAHFPSARFDIASNGEELKSKLSPLPSYDIVLSDWSLPHLDGLGVFSMVRESGLDVPFILVSGKIGEEAAIRAIKEGVYDYILKDSPHRLSMAIQHALLQYSQGKREKIHNELIALQAAALQAAPVAIQVLDSRGNIEWINEAYQQLTGRSPEEVLGNPALSFEEKTDSQWMKSLLHQDTHPNELKVKGLGKRKDNSLYMEERRVCPVRNGDEAHLQYVIIRKDITSEELEKKELELELSLSELSRESKDLHELCKRYVELPPKLSLDWNLCIQLYTDGESHLERKFCSSERLRGEDQHRSLSYRDIVLQEEVLGKLQLSYPVDSVYDQRRLLLLLLSHVEIAIKERITHAKIKSRINQISFLKLISRTIHTYMDFGSVMRPLLGQIRKILDCDAVALFLVDKEGKALVCRAKNGYEFDRTIGFSVPFEAVTIGAAAEEGRIVSNYDLGHVSPDSLLGALINKEKFLSQHAAPIIVSGQVKGILEVWFKREEHKPVAEWFILFDAIAHQTGLALDYNELYEDLQKAYSDLESSYEATIEGWSAAMDLRDEETEGHSLRVTALAVALASRLDLEKSQIAQIRRGSLLHDIGKIGIPDSILKKPGPLSEEEWKLMREHPAKALEVLSRITHLKDSLDIPLYHHEWYDGTGYPFGRKAEEIPLSARLFSIIDVYDALTSDRPYRKAWPKDKALGYLRDQKGIQFDPKLVDEFLTMIQ